jgi:hypothetical protein
MLQPRYIIGFTGHRHDIGESRVRPALAQVLTEVMQLAVACEGQAVLYSSIAQGADTLCVEVARQLGMPTHLLLPLGEEEFMKDFDSQAEWERSRRQIELARRSPGVDSLHVVPDESRRPDCYYNQGMHMLEASDVLIAVWDGKPAKGSGGTSDVVQKAIAIGTPVVQIDPVTAEIRRIGDVGKAMVPDPVITELNRIENSQRDNESSPANDPDSLQIRLDQVAIREASRFRPTLVFIILLHGIAALLAAAVTFRIADAGHWWEHGKWLVTAGELLLVTCALVLGMRIHRRHTRQTWIQCRFACEIVRGLRASIPLVDPLHPLILRHDTKWNRFALSVGLLVLAHRESNDCKALRDLYLDIRLAETHPESQIAHYRKKQPAAVFWWNMTGHVGIWSARLAPVFVLLSLLNKCSKHWTQGGDWHWNEHLIGWFAVGFLPIALPLTAGIAGGIRHVLDAGRRKQRYPQMVERLRTIKDWLADLQTEFMIKSVVNRAEEILLDELIEWRLVAETTGEHG